MLEKIKEYIIQTRKGVTRDLDEAEKESGCSFGSLIETQLETFLVST